ncbi:DUF397 domain-containing protein [Streptosporangium algeriense]|uniref:DUF397 domain-containing protein n=1 Tax=Streptosporangium algeriense TaxID=1682748 RepID=A0ABW3DLE9_9ACTN
MNTSSSHPAAREKQKTRTAEDVRASKDPSDPALTFSASEWNVFIDDVKLGTFDFSPTGPSSWTEPHTPRPYPKDDQRPDLHLCTTAEPLQKQPPPPPHGHA